MNNTGLPAEYITLVNSYIGYLKCREFDKLHGASASPTVSPPYAIITLHAKDGSLVDPSDIILLLVHEAKHIELYYHAPLAPSQSESQALLFVPWFYSQVHS